MAEQWTLLIEEKGTDKGEGRLALYLQDQSVHVIYDGNMAGERNITARMSVEPKRLREKIQELKENCQCTIDNLMITMLRNCSHMKFHFEYHGGPCVIVPWGCDQLLELLN